MEDTSGQLELVSMWVRPQARGRHVGSALASLTGGQIVKKALADTESANSVHITVTATDSGKKLDYDLAVAPGKGCLGSMTETKSGSFKLIELGQTVWILPDRTFWEQNGGSDPATLNLLSGKWMEEKTSQSGLGSVAQVCTLSTLLSGFAPLPAHLPEKTVTVSGQRVVRFADSNDPGYLDISDTAKPVLLAANDPNSSGGLIGFSDYNTPLTITAPPASQTLEGSKYGL